MSQILIHQALENFRKQSGWKARWHSSDSQSRQGEIHIGKARHEVQIPAMAIAKISAAQLPELLRQKEKQGCLLVISETIASRLATQLQELGINYLDHSGNMFLDQEPVFIWVQGKKAEKQQQVRPLFTKASIQLIFHLLTMPGLAQKTYREISEQAGVSLDTISRTLKSLIEHQYLVEITPGQFDLSRRNELLTRWIPEYGERLRPKFLLGRFRWLRRENWKSLQFDLRQTQWSGEPAADLLLQSLRPERFILYTAEDPESLLNKYRLLPDPEGPLEIYRAFWNMNLFPPSATAPTLLVYADLLLSGSARNAEVAKQLMDEQKEIILPAV